MCMCVCICGHVCVHAHACGWISWLLQWFHKCAVQVAGDPQPVPKGAVDSNGYFEV